jgi:RNA recognition motif-containing protein
MNIFVGNLSFSATENDVKNIFETFGTVTSVKIKKKSGQNSRGFGFVSMPDDLQAQAAIAGLQDKEFMGRPLNISVERPKAVKPKKDYKEIKRIRREAKNAPVVVLDDLPTIPEKKIEPKPFRKVYEEAKKFAQPTGAQTWEKRKGRGTAKPWKKKPGGVNKKFRHAK